MEGIRIWIPQKYAAIFSLGYDIVFVNFPIRIISVCSRVYPFYVLKNIRFKYKAKAIQEWRGDNYEKEIRFLKQLFAQMSEHRKKYS